MVAVIRVKFLFSRPTVWLISTAVIKVTFAQFFSRRTQRNRIAVFARRTVAAFVRFGFFVVVITRIKSGL